MNWRNYFFILEFVSCGLNNIAFSEFYQSTWKPTTKGKVKGITLNYENWKVNFASLRGIILEIARPLHVHNLRKNKRKYVGVFVSEPETKKFRSKVGKDW